MKAQQHISQLIRIYHDLGDMLHNVTPIDPEMCGETYGQALSRLEAKYGYSHYVISKRYTLVENLLSWYGYTFPEIKIYEEPGVAVINDYALEKIIVKE